MKSYNVLLVILLGIAFFPAVSASDFFDQCATTQGCFQNINQTICQNFNGFIGWWPQGTSPSEYQPYCEQVCCDVNGAAQAGVDRVVCEGYQGTPGIGIVNGPACSGTQYQQCNNGQSNCVCGSTIVLDTGATPGWCCNGIVSDTQQCSSTGGNTTPTLCGNGIRDGAELCDGDDLGVCPSTSGVTQYCTASCGCAYNGDFYDPNNGYCEPGEDDCIQQAQCRDQAQAPVVTVSPVFGQPTALIEWNINVLDVCSNVLQGFIVQMVADSDGSSAGTTATANTRNATVTVQPSKTYTVKVGATFDGQTVWSDGVSFSSGDELCFQPQRSWCDESGKSRMVCDAQNMLTTESCSGRCYPIDQNGERKAACQQEVLCEFCNGALDSFGEVRTNEVYPDPISFGSNNFNLQCDQLQDRPTSQGTVTFCYMDFSESALQEFQDCSTTTHCLDYNSQGVCADNPCNALGTCEWNAQASLCTAQEPQFQACQGTTQQACEAEGLGCLWQGNTCVASDEAACEMFSTQQTCTGGTNFEINQQTNVETATSNNRFSFPKCVWLQNQCFKDSDRDDQGDGYDVATDFTNPITTLLTPPASIEWGADITIPFIRNEGGTTFAHLTQGACGAITRPPASSSDNVDIAESTIRLTATQSGVHCLHYYSRDTARNLEYVQQEEINVNLNQLSITNFQTTIEPQSQTNADVIVVVNTSRFAFCDITFEGSSGPIGTQANQWWGDAFRIRYVDLPEDQYQVKASCSLDTGSSDEQNTTVVIDLDERITTPVPTLGTYRSSDVSIVGVHTRSSTASCVYFRGSQQVPLSTRTPVSLGGQSATRHSAPAPSNLQSGFNQYGVQCTFSDGTTISGGTADAIAFAIDDTPPRTTVTAASSGGTFVGGSTIAIGGATGSINITCTDPGIPARQQQWESGCDQTLIDRGQGYTPLVLNAQNTISITVNDGDQFSIRSIDALGNQESPQNFIVTLDDISGPERPIFAFGAPADQIPDDGSSDPQPPAPPPAPTGSGGTSSGSGSSGSGGSGSGTSTLAPPPAPTPGGSS